MLPLVMKTNLPIAVIDEKNRLCGLVMRASVISEIVGEENELPGSPTKSAADKQGGGQ
jgi:hypothetical protein